jgi:hypothetical protein
MMRLSLKTRIPCEKMERLRPSYVQEKYLGILAMYTNEPPLEILDTGQTSNLYALEISHSRVQSMIQ